MVLLKLLKLFQESCLIIQEWIPLMYSINLDKSMLKEEKKEYGTELMFLTNKLQTCSKSLCGNPKVSECMLSQLLLKLLVLFYLLIKLLKTLRVNNSKPKLKKEWWVAQQVEVHQWDHRWEEVWEAVVEDENLCYLLLIKIT